MARHGAEPIARGWNRRLHEFGGYGGAILSVDGRVEIIRTTISDNIVDEAFGGGGLALVGGSGVIRDSIFSGNQVIGEGVVFGPGIFVVAGTLSIYGSTIVGNLGSGNQGVPGGELAQAGGIYNAGTVTMANSAVVGNFAGSSFDEGQGGGINNGPNGVMTIKNGTVGGNSAGLAGGGIYNLGILRLQGVTVSGNAASAGYEAHFPTSGGGVWNGPSATFSTAGSLIAGNTAGSTETPGVNPDCTGTLISQGHNAVGNGSGCKLKGTNTHDLINVNPRLAVLADDGTAGNAHYPLRAVSPLIDAGDVVGPRCTLEDQLGQRRLDGDHEGNVLCDIGAIEFKPSP